MQSWKHNETIRAVTHHGNNEDKQPGVEVEVITTPLYAEYQPTDDKWRQCHLYEEALQLIPYEGPQCLQ